jgi:hypothetical protein
MKSTRRWDSTFSAARMTGWRSSIPGKNSLIQA